ncbi:MAG: hypothetical protein N5P05_004231 (plasmid) [Chroococcopsis gigantea SAG 12.99]|nr:hypothetical protein [Chroococcopsis gigantea SAG 12.99]
MSNPNPQTAHLEPYQVKPGDEPLARDPLTVRVPVEIDRAIRSLPDKTAWLRRVLVEAARRELIDDKSSGDFP